jgi:hypothetical protein
MKHRKVEKVWLFILVFALLAIPQASFASYGAGELQDEPLGDTGIGSHTITQPDGTGDTLPEGDDFATTVLDDPWDMATISDIYNERTQDINSVAGIKRMTIDAGLLTGTSSTTDPYFWLLYPGYENVGIDSPGKYGVNTPIDAGKYTRLTFRMYLSAVAPSDRGTVNWYRDSWLNASGHDWGQSNFFALEPGWHIYSLDLSTIGRQAGTINWGGLIQGLRVDPTSASGVDIKIDWARLTPNTTIQSSTTNVTNYQIQFTGTGSAALYSDTDMNPDNGFYSVIDKNVDLSTGSYSWETIGMPGADYHIAAQAGSDFASLVLNNAWDMKEAADVPVKSPAIANSSFSNGIFSYSVAAGGDGYFWLRNADDKPINTSKFTRLTFRMHSNVASPTNEGWYLFWWDSNETPHPISGGFRPVQSGWNIYTVDLSGEATWTGDVRRIHLKPFASGSVSANIQIDWVSVTTGSTPANEAALAVETVYGSGPITVKRAPLLHITKPSKTSGDDYANLSFGDPWDMDKSSDVDAVQHFEGTPTFTGGVFSATTDGVNVTPGGVGTGDPGITLRTGGLNTTKPINADRFKYLTWYYKEDGSAAQSGGLQDTVLGWVSRLLWWNKGAGIDSVTTKDFVINEGWNLYELDLPTTQIEHGSLGTGWSGTQTVFRFDPNEIVDKTNVHLSCIALTAPEEADASFTIRWVDFYNDTATVDPCYRGSVLDTSVVAAQADDTLATDMVDIYYDTDKDPATKTLIASDVSATARQYVWDSSAVTPGTYYIYLVGKDGFNTVGRYSEIPVTIRRAASIALTSPGATNPTVPLGTDYPREVLNNAWDMSAANDVIFQAGISSPVFNGEFSGTAADGNPYFWLNVDQAKPIAASQYKKLVFRMYASAETQGAVFWSPAAGTWHSSTPHTVLAGWHEYTIDLSAYPNWTGTMGWLRIDPVRAAGVQFKFDWIKLVIPNSSSHTVTWTSVNPGSTKMALYYDENNNGLDGNLIASGISTSANSYKWDTSAMEAGTYYIYGVVGEGSSAASSYSPGTLTVGVPLVLDKKVYLPWVSK